MLGTFYVQKLTPVAFYATKRCCCYRYECSKDRHTFWTSFVYSQILYIYIYIDIDIDYCKEKIWPLGNLKETLFLQEFDSDAVEWIFPRKLDFLEDYNIQREFCLNHIGIRKKTFKNHIIKVGNSIFL